MLKTIKELFSGNISDNTVDEKQIQLAAATLMFELIRSDGDIDEQELKSLDTILENEFGLDSSERCLLYTSPSPRDLSTSRMPSSA